MQIAECRLKLNRSGDDIPKRNVTPAEVMLLRAAFHQQAGGDPVSGVKVTGSVQRTDAQEARRLKQVYGRIKVRSGSGGAVPVADHLFPGTSPTLPDAFDTPVEQTQSEIIDTDLVTSDASDE